MPFAKHQAICCGSTDMMTSSNGNISRVIALLWGKYTGHRWIPRARAIARSFDVMFFLICAWTNSWVNNRGAGDLGRHRAHYDVTVMITVYPDVLQDDGCALPGNDVTYCL